MAEIVMYPMEYACLEKDERALLQANKLERINLDEIDRRSIRDIREWVASQADAAEELKDYESQAIAARERMR